MRRGQHNSEEAKKKMSLSKRGENNPMKRIEVRRKLSESLKGNKNHLGKYHSIESKLKMSLGNKGKHYSTNTEFKIGSKVNLGHKHTLETKHKISLAKKGTPSIMKGKSYEELYGQERAELRRKQIKEERKTRLLPKFDTSIELKVQDFLKQLNISFFTHQYIKEIEHGYQCDILIPSINLVIECDGDYWHKYPIGTEIDKIRTSELINKGFKVLRLWEREIKIMDINKFKERLQ